MAWSTRELAEVAGTTLRTVRHYHAVGLLPDPERAANGYKQYGVEHLVRVLRIRRLVDLGMSLDKILTLDESLEPPPNELVRVDAEIHARITELEQLRAELEHRVALAVPSELPTELAFLADVEAFTDADRHLVLVLSRLLAPEAMRALAASLHEPRQPEDDVFDQLPEDADEATRQRLAEAMLPHSLALRERYPDLPDLFSPALGGNSRLHSALAEIYNPAQVDVYRRMSRLRDAAT